MDTVVTRYIYDNEDVLLKLDGSNNIVARYTHGPGIDEPLIMEKSGVSSFYHADGLGSITELTDSVGTVVQSYTYSSFGKIESQFDSAFMQPYTFTAREFDPETGLYHYRARTYDSFTGRFQQEDPFPGAMVVPQSLNQYPYVLNNPINLTDPQGLAPSCQQRAKGQLVTCIAVIAFAVELPVSIALAGCATLGPGFVPCSITVIAVLETPFIVGLAVCFSEFFNQLEKCGRQCPLR